MPEADLAELYFGADGPLFTSMEEGFGLPVLEAGLAGLPVFCSDLPVLREVGGEDAHYFAPTSTATPVADLIELVLDVPGSPELRRRVRDLEFLVERLQHDNDQLREELRQSDAVAAGVHTIAV